jgi:scyllo-inositol 2-dehydrogenase (NADP+)
MTKRINTAVVGYGLSGRVFHAPFVETHPGFNLHTIVTSGHEAQKVYPKARIVQDFEDILADTQIELVAICTPHQLHKEQSIQALQAGKHVVIEKPVAMSSLEIDEIMNAATQSGRQVFPYHNRRWDGDFLTLRHLIHEGYLGEVMDFESHFDRYSPTLSRAEWRYNNEKGGGTLFDLGPHLIDQAVCLFGKPHSVWCLLHRQREGSMVSDSFDLKLIYPTLTATLRAGVFVREPGPRFQVHGSHGSYIKYGLDTQEALLKQGKMPVGDKFGAEPKKMNGLLHSVVNDKTIRLKYATFPGYYMGFYDDVADVLAGNKEAEVSIEAAHLNLKIIEAAIVSNLDKRNVEL